MEEAQEQASSVEHQASIESGVGYVDKAGLIREIPVWIPVDFFEYFPNEASAKAALENGVLRQYYFIPSDFMETGEYLLIDSEYQPLRSTNNAEIFEEVIVTNLIEQDELDLLLDNPTPNIQYHQIVPAYRTG